MLGLIKKDFYLMKSNFKTMLIIFIIYIAMAIQGSFDATIILPMFGVILLITSFNYDDYNNWNAFAIALPAGRKNIIKAKYISTIITMLATFLLGSLVSIIIASTKSNFNPFDTISLVGATTIGSFIALLLMYPLIYKYGTEKGRLLIFVFVFGFALVANLIINHLNLNLNINIPTNYYYFIIPIITVLFTYISYRLSVHIYSKKEF